eukprot:24203-Amphidinium_carterae.1
MVGVRSLLAWNKGIDLAGRTIAQADCSQGTRDTFGTQAIAVDALGYTVCFPTRTHTTNQNIP